MERGFKMKIITYGTFDTIHFGHLNLLIRAKKLGDYLIVGLSTDKFNQKKGKKCYHSYKKRKSYLKILKIVDKIIPEKNWEQKIKDIKKNKIDILVMGDDWRGKFDNLNKYCRVVYLPRTKGINSTIIKKCLNSKI